MADTARATRASGLRRDAILEAVAFAAETLLLAPDWSDAAAGVLSRIGAAADVSRAYIIQNEVDRDGVDVCIKRAEWVAEGIVSQADNPILGGLPWKDFGFARWPDVMRAGDLMHTLVEDLPATERDVLASQDIVSLACFPVIVNSGWWGLIGFDDCVSPRRWSGAELDALRASASVLGAAIARQRQDERLRDTEQRYRTVVERIPAVTYIDQRDLDGVMRVKFISPQVEDTLGYAPEDFLADPEFWYEIVHPDDLARVNEAATYSGAAVEPFDETYRMIHRSGGIVWIHDTTIPVVSPSG